MSSFERKLDHFTWESRVSSLSLPPGSDLSARHSYLHQKNRQAQTDNKIIPTQLEGKSQSTNLAVCGLCGKDLMKKRLQILI